MGKSNDTGEEVEADTLEYRPRNPDQSDLYRVLANHLNTFLARYGRDEPDATRGFLRREVRDSLECFLECGIPGG